MTTDYERGLEAGMRLQKRISYGAATCKKRRIENNIETILMNAKSRVHVACDSKCLYYNNIMRVYDDLFDNFFILLDEMDRME
jgi:hypothetical protein